MHQIQYYEEINPNICNTLNSVSPYWGKDQVLRFLYRNLAEYAQRDLQFFMLDVDGKKAKLDEGYVDIFPNVICFTLANFYCTVFNEFGIDAKVVQANSFIVPLFGVVAQGEYGNYFLNPLEDLVLNQYGLMPKAFGIIPKFKTIRASYPDLVKLSAEYIASLDNSLNFTFLDDYINEMRTEIRNYKDSCKFFKIDQDKYPKEYDKKGRPKSFDIREHKVRLFSSDFINIGNVHGTFDRALLYQFLNDSFLNRIEKKYVKVLVEDGFSEHPFISYNILKENGVISYYEEKTESGYVLTKQR